MRADQLSRAVAALSSPAALVEIAAAFALLAAAWLAVCLFLTLEPLP